MVARSKHSPTPSELADRLLADRNAIANFVSIVEDLEERVRERELRYGIDSAGVAAAIEVGRISGTADVCDWLMDYEQLMRATSSTPNLPNHL